MKREMHIPRAGIARAARVSLEVVHKAVQDGRLDTGDLWGVVCWVMMNRLKDGLEE